MALRLPKREEDRLREIAATGSRGSPASVCEASTLRLAHRRFVNIAVSRAYVSTAGQEWLAANGYDEAVATVGSVGMSQISLDNLEQILADAGYKVTITKVGA